MAFYSNKIVLVGMFLSLLVVLLFKIVLSKIDKTLKLEVCEGKLAKSENYTLKLEKEYFELNNTYFKLLEKFENNFEPVPQDCENFFEDSNMTEANSSLDGKVGLPSAPTWFDRNQLVIFVALVCLLLLLFSCFCLCANHYIQRRFFVQELELRELKATNGESGEFFQNFSIPFRVVIDFLLGSVAEMTPTGPPTCAPSTSASVDIMTPGVQGQNLRTPAYSHELIRCHPRSAPSRRQQLMCNSNHCPFDGNADVVDMWVDLLVLRIFRVIFATLLTIFLTISGVAPKFTRHTLSTPKFATPLSLSSLKFPRKLLKFTCLKFDAFKNSKFLRENIIIRFKITFKVTHLLFSRHFWFVYLLLRQRYQFFIYLASSRHESPTSGIFR